MPITAPSRGSLDPPPTCYGRGGCTASGQLSRDSAAVVQQHHVCLAAPWQRGKVQSKWLINGVCGWPGLGCGRCCMHISASPERQQVRSRQYQHCQRGHTPAALGGRKHSGCEEQCRQLDKEHKPVPPKRVGTAGVRGDAAVPEQLVALGSQGACGRYVAEQLITDGLLMPDGPLPSRRPVSQLLSRGSRAAQVLHMPVSALQPWCWMAVPTRKTTQPQVQSMRKPLMPCWCGERRLIRSTRGEGTPRQAARRAVGR